ncbi:hypothetical protein M422DRAFT_257529 [Sphaerobolus stellatus SS14]|uniref:Unplaced genomic scaffold SPHSTscaffold_75, whole genome shotgun sequence n=1 Tax=Sphaerobolus stellatus (strain SS14) TaxID=990650 RepID=A0A0C9VNP5_SPHS4|nr:hypothetical protein M422DRAFT_257529 [Sphaerobolus stellatus SS14]
MVVPVLLAYILSATRTSRHPSSRQPLMVQIYIKAMMIALNQLRRTADGAIPAVASLYANDYPTLSKSLGVAIGVDWYSTRFLTHLITNLAAERLDVRYTIVVLYVILADTLLRNAFI